MKISTIAINIWCVFVCIESVSSKALTETSEIKDIPDITTNDNKLLIDKGDEKVDHEIEKIVNYNNTPTSIKSSDFKTTKDQSENENNNSKLRDEKTTDDINIKINKKIHDEHEGGNIESEIHDVDLTSDLKGKSIPASNEKMDNITPVDKNGTSKTLTIATGESIDPDVIKTKLYNDAEEDEEDEDENEEDEDKDSDGKLLGKENEENLKVIHEKLVRALPYISFDKYRKMNKTDNDNIEDLDFDETTPAPKSGQISKDKIMDISDHSKSESKLQFSENDKSSFDGENHNSKSWFDTLMEDSHKDIEKDDDENDSAINMSKNHSIGSLKDVSFSSNKESPGNPSSVHKTHTNPVINRDHLEGSSWLDTTDSFDEQEKASSIENDRHNLDTDDSAFNGFPIYKQPVLIYPYPSDKPVPLFGHQINNRKSFDVNIKEPHGYNNKRSGGGDHKMSMPTGSNARLEEVSHPSKFVSTNPAINAESYPGSTITHPVHHGHVSLNGKMSLTNHNKQLHTMPHVTENVDKHLPVKDISMLNHISPQNPVIVAPLKHISPQNPVNVAPLKHISPQNPVIVAPLKHISPQNQAIVAPLNHISPQNPVIVPPLHSTNDKVLHIPDNQQHMSASSLNMYNMLDQIHEGVHEDTENNNNDDDDENDGDEEDVNKKMSSNVDKTADDYKYDTSRQLTAPIVSSVYSLQNNANIKESQKNDNLFISSPLTDSSQHLIMSQLNVPSVAKPLETFTDKVSQEHVSVVPSNRNVHTALDADDFELHDNEGDDDEEDDLYKPTPIASVGQLKNVKVSMNFASVIPPMTREKIQNNLPITQEGTSIASGGQQNKENVDFRNTVPNIENQLSSNAANDLHMSQLLNPSSLLPNLVDVETNTEPQMEEDKSSENDNAENDMSINFASVDPSVNYEKITHDSDPLSGYMFDPMVTNKQNIDLLSHPAVSNDGNKDDDDDDKGSDFQNMNDGITWLGSTLHGTKANIRATDFPLGSSDNIFDENKDDDDDDEEEEDHLNFTAFPKSPVDEEMNDDNDMPKNERNDNDNETKKDNDYNDDDWLLDGDMGTYGLNPPPADIQEPVGMMESEYVPLLDILDDVVNSKIKGVEDTGSKNKKSHDKNYWENRKYIEELVAEFPEMYEISGMLNNDDTLRGDQEGKLKSLIQNQAIRQLTAKNNNNNKNELSDEIEEEDYVGSDNDANHGESGDESVSGENPEKLYNDELSREHNAINAKTPNIKPNSYNDANDKEVSSASNEQGLLANSAHNTYDEESESAEENYVIDDNDHTGEIESEEMHGGSDSDARSGESASHELNVKTLQNKPYKGSYGPEHYMKSAGYRIDRKAVSTEYHADSDSDELDEETDSHEITSPVSHENNAVLNRKTFYGDEESDTKSVASASYEANEELKNYAGADNDAVGGESASHEIPILPQVHVNSNSDSRSANSGSYDTKGISPSVDGALSLESSSHEIQTVSHNNKAYGDSESGSNSVESASKGISMGSGRSAGSDNDAYNGESISHEINVVPHKNMFSEYEDSDENSIAFSSNEISGKSESAEYHAGSDSHAHNGESVSHEIMDLPGEYKFNEGSNSDSKNSGSHEIKGKVTSVGGYHTDSDVLSLESTSHEVKPASQDNKRYGSSGSDSKGIESVGNVISSESESGEYHISSDSDALAEESESNSESIESASYEINGELESAENYGRGSDSDAHSGESVSVESHMNKLQKSKSESMSADSTSYELKSNSISEESRSIELSVESKTAESHEGSDSDAHSGESESAEYHAGSDSDAGSGESESAEYHAGSDSDANSGESESAEYHAGSDSDSDSGESESTEYHAGSDSDADSGESESTEYQAGSDSDSDSGESESAEYNAGSDSDANSGESESAEYHVGSDSDANSGESQSAEYHAGSDSDANSGESESAEYHEGSNSDSDSGESESAEYHTGSDSDADSGESESAEYQAGSDSDSVSGESESAGYQAGSDSDAHSGESNSHEINVVMHKHKDHRGSSSNSHSSESSEEYNESSGSNEVNWGSESSEHHTGHDSDAHNGESASHEFSLEHTKVKNHESVISSYHNSEESASDVLNGDGQSVETASNVLSVGISVSDDSLSRELIQRKSISDEMEDESDIVADTHFEVPPSIGNNVESTDDIFHSVINIVRNSTENDDQVPTTTVYNVETNQHGQPNNPDDESKEKKIVRRLPPITNTRKQRILKIFQYLAKLKNILQKKSPPPRSFQNNPQPIPSKPIANMPKPIPSRSVVNIHQRLPPRSFQNIPHPSPALPQIRPIDNTLIQQTIHFGPKPYIKPYVSRKYGQRAVYVSWKRPIQSYGDVDDYGTKRNTYNAPRGRGGYDSGRRTGYGVNGIKHTGYGRVKSRGYGKPKQYGYRGSKSYGHKGFGIHDFREFKSYGSRKSNTYGSRIRNNYGSRRSKGYGRTVQMHYGSDEDEGILPFWKWKQPWYPTQILQNGYFGNRRRYNTYGKKKRMPYSKCRYCNLGFKTNEMQQKSHFLSAPHLNSYDSGIGSSINPSRIISDYTTSRDPLDDSFTRPFYTDDDRSIEHEDWRYKHDPMLSKRRNIFSKNIFDLIQKRRRLLNDRPVQINFNTRDDYHNGKDKMLMGYVQGHQTKGTRVAKTY